MMLLAWRMFTHEPGRSMLAIAGVFIAILMVFLQLGFYASVPVGGMAIYDKMHFDIMLASRSYVFQGQSHNFPRQRLYQAMALPDVKAIAPVYLDMVFWINEEEHLRRSVVLMAIRPGDRVFASPAVDSQVEILRKPDTVLVDSASYSMFGPLVKGRRTQIGGRSVTIGGTYKIGIGFLGLGVVLVSDQNLTQLAANRTVASINLGLVHLKPGIDPDRVASELRNIMPPDVRVFTRAELTRHEVAYWLVRTSTGIVFGFGLVVALIVGVVILNHTLATQVARQLTQYATLRAMGYSDRFLGGSVVCLGMLIVGIAFIPATGAAVWTYKIVNEATKLPIVMTQLRLFVVLGIIICLTVVSALGAMRVIRRADPADLF